MVNAEVSRMNVFEDNTKDLLLSSDRELLNLRKKLRSVAQSRNLKIDESQHHDSNNLGLKVFLESCGVDFKNFVKEYLLNVQPFMIHLDTDRSRSSSDFSCIIDPAYRMPLWVELYSTQFKEQIISFHELNWYSNKYNALYKKQDKLLCIPQNIALCGVGEVAPFTISVQKGLCRLDLIVYGTRVSEECIKVDYASYNTALMAECNRLLDSALQCAPVNALRFSEENQVSFTSYGTQIQNEISLILDLYDVTKDPRLTAPLAIKVERLASNPDYPDIKAALVEKYKSFFGIDYSHML